MANIGAGIATVPIGLLFYDNCAHFQLSSGVASGRIKYAPLSLLSSY